MKVYINGSGHVTKMAAMGIKSKHLYKSYSSEPEDHDFETLPEASVNGALQKICINHDPGMTLTYFMARSA